MVFIQIDTVVQKLSKYEELVSSHSFFSIQTIGRNLITSIYILGRITATVAVITKINLVDYFY